MRNDAGKTEKEGALRKPYEPPVLVAISLRPEEAVLGTCKNSSHSGPVSATCVVTYCKTPGS
jgi:hypothetical protein